MRQQRKLLAVVTHRSYLNAEGVWTTELYDAKMWQECLKSWDKVTVTGPCVFADPPTGATRVDGSRISFLPLPNSKGYWGALAAIPKRFLHLRNIVADHDAVVLHVPSDIGAMACYWAQHYGIPYGIDVRGDQSVSEKYLQERQMPLADLSAEIFRKLFAWVRLKSTAAIYVSKELSERFPLPDGRPMLIFSDVRMPTGWFLPPKNYTESKSPWKICTVGRLEAQKGHEYLLRALSEIIRAEPHLLTLEIIGDGPLYPYLCKLTEELQIGHAVTFRGFVPWGDQLFELLRNADVFVLSSITEGMPRAVLEAMACGLPIIATAVGGTPEIVAEEDLVLPKNVESLTNKLLEVVHNPLRMNAMSIRSCECAKHFHPERLKSGKQAFYSILRAAVDEGLSAEVSNEDDRALRISH